MYGRGIAVFYGLLTVLGLIPATNTLFGLVPIHEREFSQQELIVRARRIVQPYRQSAVISIQSAGGIVALVVVLSVLARFFQEANTVAWALCPLLAVAAIVVVDRS